MTNAELAFQFAKEVSTQLITIASALIGVSVTFIKDFRIGEERWLRASWLCYVTSICFGVLALMALTGSLESLAAANTTFEHFTTPTRWTAGGQVIMFAFGTICLVRFGWLHNLQRNSPPPVPPPPGV